MNEKLANNFRPENYVEIKARYMRLRAKGFRTRKALGEDFVSAYNKLVSKSEVTDLSLAEIEAYSELNDKFIQAMNEFEKAEATVKP